MIDVQVLNMHYISQKKPKKKYVVAQRENNFIYYPLTKIQSVLNKEFSYTIH